IAHTCYRFPLLRLADSFEIFGADCVDVERDAAVSAFGAGWRDSILTRWKAAYQSECLLRQWSVLRHQFLREKRAGVDRCSAPGPQLRLPLRPLRSCRATAEIPVVMAARVPTASMYVIPQHCRRPR